MSTDTSPGPLHQVVGQLDWLPGETAPRDGTEILLRTNTGVVSAWFDYRESTPGIDDDGHYEWVCFDDKFTIDGEEVILGWMPLPPNPAGDRPSVARSEPTGLVGPDLGAK